MGPQLFPNLNSVESLSLNRKACPMSTKKKLILIAAAAFITAVGVAYRTAIQQAITNRNLRNAEDWPSSSPTSD